VQLAVVIVAGIVVAIQIAVACALPWKVVMRFVLSHLNTVQVSAKQAFLPSDFATLWCRSIVARGSGVLTVLTPS